MSAVAFGLILTGVLLNAIAQLALKASVNDMARCSRACKPPSNWRATVLWVA